MSNPLTPYLVNCTTHDGDSEQRQTIVTELRPQIGESPGFFMLSFTARPLKRVARRVEKRPPTYIMHFTKAEDAIHRGKILLAAQGVDLTAQLSRPEVTVIY